MCPGYRPQPRSQAFTVVLFSFIFKAESDGLDSRMFLHRVLVAPCGVKRTRVKCAVH